MSKNDIPLRPDFPTMPDFEKSGWCVPRAAVRAFRELPRLQIWYEYYPFLREERDRSADQQITGLGVDLTIKFYDRLCSLGGQLIPHWCSLPETTITNKDDFFSAADLAQLAPGFVYDEPKTNLTPLFPGIVFFYCRATGMAHVAWIAATYDKELAKYPHREYEPEAIVWFARQENT